MFCIPLVVSTEHANNNKYISKVAFDMKLSPGVGNCLFNPRMQRKQTINCP